MKLKFVVIALLFAVMGCAPTSQTVPVPSPSPGPSPSPSPSPSPTPSEPPLDVDALYSATPATREKVREHVRKFITDAETVGLDVVSLLESSPKLEIRIASLDGWGSGVIGLCQTGAGYRIVTLDPDYFGAHNAVADRVLSHHELGHCVLYRGHRTVKGYLPDGSGHFHELSVMYPTIMGRARYEAHEPYYVDELFTELANDGSPRVHICQ